MAKFHRQIAALPWRRRKGGIEVLLITSRETRRWVIPKGWPMDQLIDSNAAKREAYEEAGVEGHVKRAAFGTYDYLKRNDDGDIRCRVSVYPLEVSEELRTWPEQAERKRQWLAPEEAAQRVNESGLKMLLRAFRG